MAQRHFGSLHLLAASAALASAVVVPAQVRAQQDQGRDELEQIVVTAQKRAESLQEVPIAITALSEEVLTLRGIASPTDLQFSVPNLNIGQEAGNGWTNVVATIRGVGTVNALLDPGVPMHINGHYMQSTAVLARDFVDVERVEVLRGPQGTLYGRNAIGGSINIITRRPTDEFEGVLALDMGNFDKRLVRGTVSGPLSENVRGRLTVSDETRDGYVRNMSALGADSYENSNYTAIRGYLDYDLTDDLTLQFSGYYYDSRMNSISFRRFNPYPPLGVSSSADWFVLNGAGENPTVHDRHTVKMDNPGETHDRARGFAVDAIWEFDSFELRSLTSYDDSQTTRWADLDASDVIATTTYTDLPMETFTQDLQVLFGGEGPLSGQAGIFYYYQDSPLFTEFANDNTVANLYDLDTPRAIFQETYSWKVRSLGLYGQVQYALTDALELVVGGRYTRDSKDQVSVSGGNFDGTLDLETVTLDKSWNQFTYRVGLNYQATDDVMLYTSYATGYKAGGIFILSTYEPEFVNAYEIGVKSDWFGRRLRLNAAAFHSDYEDKQERIRLVVDGVLTPGGMIQNIPNTVIRGLELEAQALLGDRVSLDASLTWQDSEYDGIVIEDPIAPGGVQDISGNQLANSAKWRAYAGLEHTTDFDAGTLALRADVSYVGKRHGSIYNYEAGIVPAYEWVNVRARWDSPDGAWRADFYIKNLLDEEAMSGRAYVPFDEFGYPDLGTFLPPRTYGVELTRFF
ncbi:MAG TPA: TonB-dependent receptor [Woeseiaceae bacterium]|nr:TonB-dependent receptor [Woeseiaceae bacterium]